jgi:polar amino acid transport system permease protein
MSRITFKKIDVFIISILLLFSGFLIYRINNTLNYHFKWGKVFGYIISIDSTGTVFGPILKGVIYTLKLSFWSIIFATILGFIVGVLRTVKRPFFKIGSFMFVEVNRNIPPIVLIFIFYFFVSEQIFNYFQIDTLLRSFSENTENILGFLFAPPNLLSSFFAGILTLTIYEGCYIAEIVKAGVESIDKGQTDAGYALGLSKYNVLKHIVIPQGSKIIIPPLTGQYISIIKGSAIASVVAIPELTFQGLEVMAATFLTFETWIVVTAIYFVLTFSMSLLSKSIEKKFTGHF